MQRVTVLIPVKTLALGKSRLSGALSPEHRVRLTEDVLRRLIHLLHGERRVDAIAVVSRDPHVRSWLRGRRVRLLRESGEGLNAALREARAQLPGIAALLVLPSDLAADLLAQGGVYAELERIQREGADAADYEAAGATA